MIRKPISKPLGFRFQLIIACMYTYLTWVPCIEIAACICLCRLKVLTYSHSLILGKASANNITRKIFSYAGVLTRYDNLFFALRRGKNFCCQLLQSMYLNQTGHRNILKYFALYKSVEVYTCMWFMHIESLVHVYIFR